LKTDVLLGRVFIAISIKITKDEALVKDRDEYVGNKFLKRI
jgi:hypothetical protein